MKPIRFDRLIATVFGIVKKVSSYNLSNREIMKNYFNILLIVSVFAMIAYGCSDAEPDAPEPVDPEYDVVVSGYGDLADTLKTKRFKQDSIAVHGPIDSTDIKALTITEIKVLNLRDATVSEGIVPLNAFFRGVGIDDRRIYLPSNSVELRGRFSAYEVAFVEIPEGVEIIPERSFYRCKSLREVVVPNSLKVIKRNAFCGADIKNFRFPENLERIESYAFSSTLLEEVILNDKCSDIQSDAFDSNHLKRVRLPKALRWIPAKFANGMRTLTEVEFSGGNEVIGEGAFHGSNINKIILPEGVRVIEINSLYSFDTREIDLPSTIEKIGKEAFLISSEYTQFVRIHAITPPQCDARGFRDISNGFNSDPESNIDIPLYVPKGSAEKYRNATGWSRFSNIIEE